MNNKITDPDMKELIEGQRIRQLALAVINRGRDAGIPDKHLRINKVDFSNLLDDGSYKHKAEFVEKVYGEPSFLLDKEFITIDGGNEHSRRRAGFALLFRLLSYNDSGEKPGLYRLSKELSHKFQTILSDKEMSRNTIVGDLKEYASLFISEVSTSDFRTGFECGDFFDEILVARADSSLPTIISFEQPISSKNDIKDGMGKYLNSLWKTPANTKRVLRIRVKINE